MGRKTPYGIFISSLMFGIFIGIWLVTGTDISPDSLMLDIAQSIFNSPILFIAIGVGSLVADIWLLVSFIMSNDWKILISAFLGFLAGVLIFVFPPAFILPLLVGIVFAELLHDD